MLKPLTALAAAAALTALTVLATVTAVTALLMLAAPAANAAGLSPNLSIHASGLTGTATVVGRTYPGPRQAPPVTHYSASNLDDSSGNLNPGSGGGSGTTPVKKPNLQ